MSRTSIPVVLVLALALVTAPMAVAALPSDTQTSTPADGEAVQPGEKLSGAVAVQGAEIDGEVQERTFGLKVARANSNASKAKVVAAEVENVGERLQELQQRKQTLKEARRNGSISQAEFRTGMAELAARTETVKRLANRSEDVANGLPADVLAANGVNVSAIQQLQRDAADLSGPQVAKIARSVAGKDVGKSMAGGQGPGDAPNASNGSQGPGDAGPGGDAGDGARNGSDEGAGSGSGAGNGTGDDARNGTDTGSATVSDGVARLDGVDAGF